MRRFSFAECYRVLGLPDSATFAEVKAAFRRLAKWYHPDTNSTSEGQRRFIDIVSAYHILREKLRVRPADSEWGFCARCRRYAVLYLALAGGRACRYCLLGETQRRRYLPLPAIVVVKHVSVFALYAACVLLLLRYLDSGELNYAASSFLCALSGLAVLAGQVIWLTRNESAVNRIRSGARRAEHGR